MKEIRKFSEVQFLGDYINGKFILSNDPDFSFFGKSPADKLDTIGTIHGSYNSVEDAVFTAAKNRDSWAKADGSDRKTLIYNFIQKMKEYSNELADIISRETGKPRWESLEEIIFALSRGQAYLEDFEQIVKELLVPNSKTIFRMKPRGTALVLGHYNCPVDSAFSSILPSLLHGNTVIYKPSKKTPAVGQMIAKCIDAVRFPPGVFSLVQGGREMARRLAQHSDIDTVFYAGDYEFAKQLRKDTFEHSEKLLILETGGKNPAIVLSDANQNLALQEILISSYITCGQRADSTSRIILQENIAEQFLNKFHEAAKKIVIGNPFNEDKPSFMGPLVDKKTMDRYLTFQGTAVREQAECIMRGKSLSLESDGFYVSPSIYLFKENSEKKILNSTYLQTEIFGPSVAVHIVKDEEEAAVVANASNYGLSCSVFTCSEEKFRNLWQKLRYGIIPWNAGTIRRDALLPITGIKRSCNAAPLVRSISCYVNYSVNSLELPEAHLLQKLPPGVFL